MCGETAVTLHTSESPFVYIYLACMEVMYMTRYIHAYILSSSVSVTHYILVCLYTFHVRAVIWL